jgi:hypothetical protein
LRVNDVFARESLALIADRSLTGVWVAPTLTRTTAAVSKFWTGVGSKLPRVSVAAEIAVKLLHGARADDRGNLVDELSIAIPIGLTSA